MLLESKMAKVFKENFERNTAWGILDFQMGI